MMTNLINWNDVQAYLKATNVTEATTRIGSFLTLEDSRHTSCFSWKRRAYVPKAGLVNS